MSPAQQSTLLEKHMPLVGKIACHMRGKLFGVRLDELIQSGMIGLWKAIQQYEPVHEASFETYAGIRITGEIVDVVRAESMFPRHHYRDYLQVRLSQEIFESLVDEDDPLAILEMAEIKRAIKNAPLRRRQRQVFGLYYEDELQLKEIGAMLGLSESGVCYLKREAEKKIAKHIGENS